MKAKLDEPKKQTQLTHDINSAISALNTSMEVITHEWRDNPELVKRLLFLSVDKMQELQQLLEQFYQK